MPLSSRRARAPRRGVHLTPARALRGVPHLTGLSARAKRELNRARGLSADLGLMLLDELERASASARSELNALKMTQGEVKQQHQVIVELKEQNAGACTVLCGQRCYPFREQCTCGYSRESGFAATCTLCASVCFLIP